MPGVPTSARCPSSGARGATEPAGVSCKRVASGATDVLEPFTNCGRPPMSKLPGSSEGQRVAAEVGVTNPLASNSSRRTAR